MTLKEIINYADIIKPNAFTNDIKTLWINEAEGKVQTEVMLLSPNHIISYDYDTDEDTELLVRAPHDKLYAAYLMAMIDFGNAEYGKYQNSMELFNGQFGEFVRYFAKRYRPADRKIHLPPIWHIVRGETAILDFFALPTRDIGRAVIYIRQKGKNVLHYDSGDEEETAIEQTDGGIRATIQSGDSKKLMPGWAKAALIIYDGDGNRYESYPPGRLKIEQTAEDDLGTLNHGIAAVADASSQ